MKTVCLSRRYGHGIKGKTMAHSPLDLLHLKFTMLGTRSSPRKTTILTHSFSPSNKDRVENIFFQRCVLYLPPNRFEEPAWLNEDNLKAQAQYMNLRHMQGQTERKVINYSPLHENQNWLFDLIYDRAVFEIQTHQFNLPVNNSNTTLPLPIFAGYSGTATSIYETALRIVRNVVRREDARFGVGLRNDRRISIESGMGQLIPNIFQLSSGETALLNLFLSILRDFGLCGAHFSNDADVARHRGGRRSRSASTHCSPARSSP